MQKGTPKENWLFVKMKLDGTVVLKITAPAEAGFKAPNEWRLTAAVPGAGRQHLYRQWLWGFAAIPVRQQRQLQGGLLGSGKADGLMDCSHGLAVDTRYDQPLLLVCDRENRRLCHFDFDGKFVGTVTQHLRRPCQISFHGDFAVISELEGASPSSTATTCRWHSSAIIHSSLNGQTTTSNQAKSRQCDSAQHTAAISTAAATYTSPTGIKSAASPSWPD